MPVLFLHQNFPGQFKHLAPALAAAGHEVVAMPMRAGDFGRWQGVDVMPYRPGLGSTAGVHPWVLDLEIKAVRAAASARQMLRRRETGFVPRLLARCRRAACDAAIAHPSWGESLGVKTVWPGTRLGLYCEVHYRSSGADVGFDPEFPRHEPLDAPGARC
jgi:hypothetical protein